MITRARGGVDKTRVCVQVWLQTCISCTLKPFFRFLEVPSPGGGTYETGESENVGSQASTLGLLKPNLRSLQVAGAGGSTNQVVVAEKVDFHSSLQSSGKPPLCAAEVALLGSGMQKSVVGPCVWLDSCFFCLREEALGDLQAASLCGSIDQSGEGDNVGQHFRLAHSAEPLVRTCKIPLLRSCIDHSIERNPARLQSGICSYLEPSLGSCEVACTCRCTYEVVQGPDIGRHPNLHRLGVCSFRCSKVSLLPSQA
mmetsp:Transcript_45629/g.108619  ORF Transcript_45629/g.108619 Transcript_45629/m.108619 type:complete len:255 (-) Transcript_45629:1207-1971(-)